MVGQGSDASDHVCVEARAFIAREFSVQSLSPYTGWSRPFRPAVKLLKKSASARIFNVGLSHSRALRVSKSKTEQRTHRQPEK